MLRRDLLVQWVPKGQWVLLVLRDPPDLQAQPAAQARLVLRDRQEPRVQLEQRVQQGQRGLRDHKVRRVTWEQTGQTALADKALAIEDLMSQGHSTAPTTW